MTLSLQTSLVFACSDSEYESENICVFSSVQRAIMTLMLRPTNPKAIPSESLDASICLVITVNFLSN